MAGKPNESHLHLQGQPIRLAQAPNLKDAHRVHVVSQGVAAQVARNGERGARLDEREVVMTTPASQAM